MGHKATVSFLVLLPCHGGEAWVSQTTTEKDEYDYQEDIQTNSDNKKQEEDAESSWKLLKFLTTQMAVQMLIDK